MKHQNENRVVICRLLWLRVHLTEFDKKKEIHNLVLVFLVPHCSTFGPIPGV